MKKAANNSAHCIHSEFHAIEARRKRHRQPKTLENCVFRCAMCEEFHYECAGNCRGLSRARARANITFTRRPLICSHRASQLRICEDADEGDCGGWVHALGGCCAAGRASYVCAQFVLGCVKCGIRVAMLTFGQLGHKASFRLVNEIHITAR